MGGEFQISLEVGGGNVSDIALLSNGDFAVTWTGSSKFVRVFDSSGVGLTGDIAANTVPTDAQYFSRFSALANGEFVVVYSDGGGGNGHSVYGQILDSSGTKVGGEFALAPGAGKAGANVVTLADGNFVTTWAEFGHPQGPVVLVRRTGNGEHFCANRDRHLLGFAVAVGAAGRALPAGLYRPKRKPIRAIRAHVRTPRDMP